MLEFNQAHCLTYLVVAVLAGGCDTDETPSGSGGTTSSPSDDESTSAETSSNASTGVDEGTTSATTSGGDSTTGEPADETSTSWSTSTGSVSTQSTEDTGAESSTSGGSTGGTDIDTVCTSKKGEAVCETPSLYDADGECDPYAQDCDEGEKCAPVANDGGTSWNSTHCTPVPQTPDLLDQPCTVEGSGVSGIDSCDVGLMCWDVDGETNTGTCIELCGCGPVQPTCAGGGTVCSVANDGVLPLCLPTCDPLDSEANCENGQGCYPVGDSFQCAPDASGDEGSPNTPCSFINGCDPGSACVSDDLVPGCVGAGCCTSFCDLDEPNSCSGGMVCEAWFPMGEEPLECHVDTGICVAE